MIARRAAPGRLTLRTRPSPPAGAIASGILGLALLGLAALLRDDPRHLPAALAGSALVVPLLWSARPGPTVVIDMEAGELTARSTLGRLERRCRFTRIDSVTTDRVTLPSPRPGAGGATVFRTVLNTDAGPLAVQGFGAAEPARALARRIARWHACAGEEAPGP